MIRTTKFRDLTSSQLRRYEEGHSRIRTSTLYAMAKEFGIFAVPLFDGSQPDAERLVRIRGTRSGPAGR